MEYVKRLLKWRETSTTDLALAKGRMCSNFSFVWNPGVTPEVNIFMWWACIGRLATQKELSKRGMIMNLPDLFCVSCRVGIEDHDHIFVICLVATEVWSQILGWVRMPSLLIGRDINNLLKAADSWNGNPKVKKVLCTVLCHFLENLVSSK
ncbi:putative reverse transcriptase zinc-binding domain-containing protein [Helianthus anomalus]